MPLTQTSANATARAGGYAKNALVRIYDLFNRVTSGGLGTTTSGSVWHAIVGIWTSNSGVAETASSPSTYPMATVVYQPNAILTLQNVSPGSGLCFWQTDTGDWWGAVASAIEVEVQTGTEESYSSCCSGSNTCVYNACCSLYIIGYTGSGVGCPGTYEGCAFTSNTYGFNSGCTFECCTANSCCSGSNTCVGGDCVSTPVYTNYYNFVLQILQSVASAVSVIASSILASLPVSGGGNGIQSVAVSTSGESVTATGYSDTDMADSLGSLNVSAGSVPTGTGVGIMLTAVDSSASAIQGSTVGPFTAV